MVEGGMKCIKVLLFAFNFVFVLAGIGLIGVGAYVQIQLKEYFALIEGQFSSAAALLIAVGVIIFIIAAFGCCGAWKENYICVMIVESKVEELMKKSLEDYHPGSVWDKLQQEFQCCGAKNYTEYEGKLQNNTVVPKSCCKADKTTCTGTQADVSAGNIYKIGCLDSFVNWVKDRIFIIGGVGIGLAFVQIVGILFACCLARALKKEYEVV
ncbi:hypothetical protein KUTeg_002551 [Tegillarca granosa]|uniref:Tetraspanin n=1 Tax=Tegillarca granosa TaxID=220873 RepID=A0ABQ9FUM4_TEGGR|nr:hypothetical protein KUTeg_002551 [Tegillarca granosa]